MNFLTKFFKKLWSDFMKAPKTTKIVTIILLVLTVSLGTLFLTGCGIGPSKAYVIKMDNRAAKHFPRYIYFVKNATVPQIENILNKEPGVYNKAKPEDIKFLRDALLDEINSWWYLIKANRELIEKKKE